jgi:hypothetical protein
MPTDKDQDGLARQIADEVVERLGVLLARDTRPLLSVPQVAERLGISDKGAWNIVQRGELPSVLVGVSRAPERPYPWMRAPEPDREDREDRQGWCEACGRYVGRRGRDVCVACEDEEE